MTDAQVLPWKSFLALGDSLTEGVGDPAAGGLRGWADRLAEGLRALRPDLVYVNLAYRGLTTSEIRADQLDRALEMRPDIASVIAGMNDLIRPTFDVDRFQDELDELVAPLCEMGSLVLTATFPDITLFLRLPATVKRALHQRLEDANEVVRRVSRRHDTLLVDARDVADSTDRRITSVDRLHPGPRGHLVIARAFASLLSERAGASIELPDPDGGKIGAGKLLQARWLLAQTRPTDVVRYVVRTRLAGRSRRG